jgi:diguanylate cyclase (GGDEF)-like protein
MFDQGLFKDGLGIRPAAPAIGILALAFATVGLETAGTRWGLVLAAALAAVALTASGWVVPWRRLPAWAMLVLPLGCDAVLAVLRQAQGGSTSGYGPLAALPAVWVGLTLGRRAVGTIAIATLALFGLPIVVAGAPLYPESGWRLAVLWTVVALIIGLVVNAVVTEQRRQAGLAHAHAHDLDETQRALNTIAAVTRELSGVSPVRARQMICETAVGTDSAVLATIVEPGVDGSFAITGAAGIPIPQEQLRESVRPQASLRAFYARTRVLISDVEADVTVSPLIAKATGLKSILYEPILRQSKPVGVLCVGWATRRDELPNRSIAVYSSLAAEAGAAIERADLLWQLDQLARTDELTGLLNRRAWDEQLASRSAQRNAQLSVALLDLDRFKAYNDTHGHLAGDALLQQVAATWRAILRPGDVLARYGGEEFALLLPDCRARDACPIVNRLCQATPGGATCSAGIAEYDPSRPDLLMRQADEALYAAKAAGRNRVMAA